MTIKEHITAFLATQGIDCCGFLDREYLSVIQPHLMPENIRGAAIWLIPYYTGAHPDRNISLYSVNKDYHLFSRALGNALIQELSEAFPEEKCYSFCDSSPLGEVKAAIDAGLGVLGKNRLLIHPRYGSFVFIGSLLTTAKLENASPCPLEPSVCPGCGRCTAACGYLAGKEPVCASELNQRKELTDSELHAVRSRKIRWGCDICQEVCPLNRDVPLTPIPFFYEEQMETLDIQTVEAMPKSEFRKRAFAWRGKKTILRNLSDNE